MVQHEMPSPSPKNCSVHTEVEYHIMVESWFRYWAEYDLLYQLYPAEAPRDAGDMGYLTISGEYLPGAARRAAENSSGLALEYYKSYNPQWFRPWDYFDSMSALNKSLFSPCDGLGVSNNGSMFDYLQNTGDVGGVKVAVDGYKLNCLDGLFWLSPACRSDESQCIFFLTTAGWGVRQMMEKSAAFFIPVAIGSLKLYSDYASLPTSFKALFYWWTPDETFVDVDPRQVIFPPHSAYEWSLQRYATMAEALKVSKIASPILAVLAPEVARFLQNSILELDAMNSMLRAFKSQVAVREIACQWLRNNEPRWRRWIPVATECGNGFGLFNEATRSFVETHEAASTCAACLPGTYSAYVNLESGETRICKACPAGQQQPAAASMECEPCPAGTSKPLESQQSCQLCPLGSFQDEEGAWNCKQCPETTTTVFLGAKDSADCVCMAGTIDLANESKGSSDCVACMEGLQCPAGATVASLLGETMDGLVILPGCLLPPFIRFVFQIYIKYIYSCHLGQWAKFLGLGDGCLSQGYHSTRANPLETYKCPAFCPGGAPGSCEGGRVGNTCAECPQNMYWSGDSCEACEVSWRVAWIITLVALPCLVILAYHLTETSYQPRPSLKDCITTSLDMALAHLQNLGILSQVQVPWPQGLQDVFQFSSLFVLNLQNMGLSCASHGDVEQYSLTAVARHRFVVILL